MQIQVINDGGTHIQVINPATKEVVSRVEVALDEARLITLADVTDPAAITIGEPYAVVDGPVPIEIYPQHDAEGKATGEFGWRQRDAEGEITAVGGEGFETRDTAEAEARKALGQAITIADVEE